MLWIKKKLYVTGDWTAAELFRVCARNLPAKNASGALPNCWGPKKGLFLLIGHPLKGLGGGELSPPPLTPRSRYSTSVQACSLLALAFPICYRHFWPDWILSAFSRRPLVQEISPTCNKQRRRNGVCSGGVRRRDQVRRGGKKVCVGKGNISPVIFISKEVNSLQGSNVQLQLLTFCAPQAKREGGILQRLVSPIAEVSLVHRVSVSS